MNDQLDLELERYELFANPIYNFTFNRRQFLKVFTGGIALLVPATNLLAQRDQGESGGRGRMNERVPNEIGAWIHVDETGTVSVFTGKVELGQNIRTSLAQAVAEELHVPLNTIRMVMADTDLVPFDAGTFGSRSIPFMAPQLRKAAAAARETLVALAAEQLKVAPADVRIVNARFVNHDASKSLSFADVAKGRKLVKAIPADIAITAVNDWTIAGKSVPKVGARDFVTGKHEYTSDLKRPGMLFGRVVRAPAVNSTLVSADTKAAEAIRGVTVVRDGDFIGIAAPDPQTLARAEKAMAVHWKTPAQPGNAELFAQLKRESSPGRGGRSVGSMADGLAAADKKLAQSYTIAYIAHAPLEPRAAVAEWKDNKLTVWTGTQRPFGVRSELAEAFRIPEESVRVIVPDTGSGYGGKHTGECAIETARLARASGKPVKLVWTREEEFTWAYFRPAGVIEVSSGVKNDGTVTAWEFHNYNSGASAIQSKYAFPNEDIQFHSSKSPLRQGSYRGLAATANHFAREVHMDELAHLVGMDPVAFRLKNIQDERLRAVLEAAAKSFGWEGARARAGRGSGIACGFEKGSYIATAAEVSVDAKTKKVKLERVVASFECGAIVNPVHLHNQVEGAVVQAIGGALFEAIEFRNGQILNGKFSKYRLPRFSDVPAIEIVLLDRKDLPSAGAGETPIVGLAPAIGNAIFDATGERIRSLPLASGKHA